jgi:hypothetical protein
MTGLLFSMIFFKTALYGEPFSVPFALRNVRLVPDERLHRLRVADNPDKTTYPAMLAAWSWLRAARGLGRPRRLHALALSATGLVVAGA